MVETQRRRLPGPLPNRGAYISMEVMLAVFVVSFCTMLMTSALRLFIQQPSLSLMHDLHGIMQLQELVARSEILSLNESRLTMQYEGEEVVLEMINQRLIRKPGTVIYLASIEEVLFCFEDELIILQFKRSQKEWRYVLGKKEWWRD